MISLKILDLKTFMSELLVHEMFDMFLLSELKITTSNNFEISGKLYKDFFDNNEKELLKDRDHSFWKDIKPIAFNIIKGDKLPISMKIVLMLPRPSIESIVGKTNNLFKTSDVNAMFLNFNYSKGDLICTTASSMNLFTLDKTLDYLWDEMAISFLRNKGIVFEEL